ncbi:MAG: DNA-directed RNA polymerase specialized sigma24 family protein [Verrucomicrobiales bacterium]|jgi:DNA-directed RNA polymerase specialized sigma24 family protein
METDKIALTLMSIESSPPADEEESGDAKCAEGSTTLRVPLPRDAFPLTSLTEVMNLRGDDVTSQEALASLCEKYWYPLYAFLRRRGHDKEDAQDLTQGFFAKFLSGKAFGEFDPQRGKLRTYMLGALKHYESSDRREKKTLKRGGGFEFVSFDWMNAESWYGAEPAHIDSPELIFDRRWAITLLANVQEKLLEGYTRKGKGELFEALHIFLDARADKDSLEEVAGGLGMSRAAVKMAISRMRDRRRQIMRAEIGKTVGSHELIDEEISHLISLFQAPGEAVRN